MYLDKHEFDKKCTAVMRDVQEQEIRNPVWAWMALGALAGFVASCIKIKRPTGRPIVADYKRVRS